MEEAALQKQMARGGVPAAVHEGRPDPGGSWSPEDPGQTSDWGQDET